MNTLEKEVSGNLVDLFRKEIYGATLKIQDGRIVSIQKNSNQHDQYIVPGLIDSHVHIESSMLIPSEFARLAVPHGTVAVVSDPHEIANVMGMEGIKYMIENAETVPFKFYFGAPSCVPATGFETAGAQIGPDNIEELFKTKQAWYLSEVMNYPGVINKDPFLLKKMNAAKKYNLKIDGHAPGLTGDDCISYINSGITTDHECITKEEALFKIKNRMKIHIREGSASKDFNTLSTLIHEHYENIMFCSDDKHPDDLAQGHINDMVKRAVANDMDIMKVLQCACVNPVEHYGLDVGLLREKDPADFIIIDDLKSFNILETYINGTKVSQNKKSLIESENYRVINSFKAEPKTASDFVVKVPENLNQGYKIKVIRAIDEQLLTDVDYLKPVVVNDIVITDPQHDVLKIVVINRYVSDETPSIAFIRGFGLKKGAIGASVAHDSHNIIVIGCTDKDITTVANEIIKNKGGICAFDGHSITNLPLEVAGLMTTGDGYNVAKQYEALDRLAKNLGSTLTSPFMTLSFMALLVIPSLKIGDMGLFDVQKFDFTNIFVQNGNK